jgi:hypothetical protein
MDEWLTHEEILLLFYALHYQAHEHNRIVDRLMDRGHRDGRDADALANDEEIWGQVEQRDKLKALAAKLLEFSTPANNNL